MGIEAKYEGLPCDCDCTEGECQHCLHRAEIARLRGALQTNQNNRIADGLKYQTSQTRVAELEAALRNIAANCETPGPDPAWKLLQVRAVALEKTDEA